MIQPGLFDPAGSESIRLQGACNKSQNMNLSYFLSALDTETYNCTLKILRAPILSPSPAAYTVQTTIRGASCANARVLTILVECAKRFSGWGIEPSSTST